MTDASHHSRIPREQFPEAAQVNYGARKYLEELEQENGDGEAIHQQDKVSTTDPDSTYLTKGNRAAELVDTGMRVGIEALRLKWSDIDFEESIITVAQSKTAAGLRALPMTAFVRSELQKWRPPLVRNKIGRSGCIGHDHRRATRTFAARCAPVLYGTSPGISPRRDQSLGQITKR